jgi:hypothetical protein
VNDVIVFTKDNLPTSVAATPAGTAEEDAK